MTRLLHQWVVERCKAEITIRGRKKPCWVVWKHPSCGRYVSSGEFWGHALLKRFNDLPRHCVVCACSFG